jgi:hypothetical protein
MFEKNTLTFNPGWDRACNTLSDFDDVRDIQKLLKAQGLPLVMEADETSTGPGTSACWTRMETPSSSINTCHVPGNRLLSRLRG